MGRVYPAVFLVLLGGCTGANPPVDIIGLRLIMACLFNCPVTVNMADEGEVTDSVAQEPSRIDPENLATALK